MHVQAFKTPIVTAGQDLYPVLTKAIPQIPERSVLVVASKLFSTSENRFVPKITGTPEEKHALVRKEAEFYTDPHSSKYNLMLTIKRNWMFVNAGIDESNADGKYLLWPEDPQRSVNALWKFIRSHYGVKEVGVTMSDSASIPLNWGVTGLAIAYCGFKPLYSYIGRPDLFGRAMKMEQVSVVQSLTTAAVFEMGEGDEATPLGLVTELGDKVVFEDHVPSDEELKELKIEIEDDVFAPVLTKAEWKRG